MFLFSAGNQRGVIVFFAEFPEIVISKRNKKKRKEWEINAIDLFSISRLRGPHQVPTKTLAKPRDYRSSANEAPQCALDGTPLPNVVEYIKEGKVDLVINIPEVRGGRHSTGVTIELLLMANGYLGDHYFVIL